jgi:hypothetical protein
MVEGFDSVKKITDDSNIMPMVGLLDKSEREREREQQSADIHHLKISNPFTTNIE